MSQPTQEDFRWEIREAIAYELHEMDYHDLADAVMGLRPMLGDKGLDKAVDEVYAELDKALRMLSRLAVRMGYITKESK